MEEGIVEKPIISISFADDSWDTIAKIVKSGKASEKYKLGETKEVTITGYTNTPEKPTFTVRIANMSTPEECKQEGFSQTACGFVVEFVDIISISSMNENRTNVGGWPASKIVKFLNTDSKSLLSLLPIDLQELILPTVTVSSHGESEKVNFNMDNKLYLLSAREIYGFEGELNSGSKDSAHNLTRDLEYYKEKREKLNSLENKEIYIKKYKNLNNSWWLRSASSHIDFRNGFFDISETGEISFTPATFEEGVAPAFRIG